MLTNDLDFSAILAVSHGEKPSVVQIRASNLNPSAIGARVIDAIRQMSDALESGALITIEPGRNLVGVFPNSAALLRIAGAVLVEQHDEWEAANHPYFLRRLHGRTRRHEQPHRGGEPHARNHCCIN